MKDYLHISMTHMLDTPDSQYSQQVAFSPKQVSRMLDVPVSLVYNLCCDGELKALTDRRFSAIISTFKHL